MKANHHYRELFQPPAGVRYFILMGGRSAGRSTAGSQFALSRLRDLTRYFRCAIMRFVASDIRNSIYQDILDRIDEQALRTKVGIIENRLTFQVGQNKIIGIGFKKSSGDQKSKLKSLANFNCVIIEEADEVLEEDFMQLDDSLRTAKSDIVVILQLNPPDKNHWIIKRWFNLVDVGVPGFYKAVKKPDMTDTVVISTCYLQNLDNINETSIRNFERYKDTRPDYYWNMIRGLVSEGKRGRIFKTWKPLTYAEFKELPYPSIYGLDFGFTNDPTALIEIKMHNQTVWFHQHIYERGLTNPLIAKRFEDVGLTPDDIIYADSAEPKSIQELNDLGWYVLPAEKGKDSVNARYDWLLGMEQVYYTQESVVEGPKGQEGLVIEVQEHCWRLDKNKEPTNKPEDDNNHALDAGMYGGYTHSRQSFIGFA